ncbi:glutamate--tRNA ligase family protein, partial [Acinetobacter baumannii]
MRIEDTDRSRYSAEAEDYQYEALKWCGIEFDESPQMGGPHAPYRQSERKDAGIYESTIQRLLNEGLAYKAFDTSQELDDMRE